MTNTAYINDSWIIVSPESYRSWSTKETSNEVDLIGRKIVDSKLIEWLNQNNIGITPSQK